jgi:hypothetical protein
LLNGSPHRKGKVRGEPAAIGGVHETIAMLRQALQAVIESRELLLSPRRAPSIGRCDTGASGRFARIEGEMVGLLRGSQRRTLVCGPLAIKFPRPRRFVAGLRANREEARLWREGWGRFYPELCPVLACAPFGLALVMPAVRIMSREEFAAFRESEAYPQNDPDPELYESKLGEWGYLGSRPVVVDYAMRVHMTAEDIALIDPAVRTIEDARRYFAAD